MLRDPHRMGREHENRCFFAQFVGKKTAKKSSPPPWGGGRGVGLIAVKKVSYTKDSQGKLPVPVHGAVQKRSFWTAPGLFN